MWFGLEINLFRVLPLFLGTGSAREAESAAKYFVVQAIGSAVLLMGSFVRLWYFGTMFVRELLTLEMGKIVVSVGLLVKAGLVPFHFWIPRVIRGMGWESCFILRVWQKLGPLSVLVFFVEGPLMQALIVSGCLGSLVGGLGGFSQTQVRALLGYSSINHAGWLVAGGMYRVISFMIYYCIYFLVMWVLLFLLSLLEVRSYKSLSKGFRGVGVKYLMPLALALLTLAGLPPTVGFSIKWAVFWGIVSAGGYYTIVTLMVGSLLRLYYYICMAFCWFVFTYSAV